MASQATTQQVSIDWFGLKGLPVACSSEENPPVLCTSKSPDACPVVQEGAAKGLVAGDAIQFRQSQQGVKAFPAGLRRAEILDARKALAIIVAGLFEILEHLLGHAQVARLARLAIEQRQAVKDAHVHFLRAGVEHAPPGVEEGVAHQIADPPGGSQGSFVARLFVPEEQTEHHVVIAPEVPVPEKLLLRGPAAKIAVLGLQLDQTVDDLAGDSSQAGIVPTCASPARRR